MVIDHSDLSPPVCLWPHPQSTTQELAHRLLANHLLFALGLTPQVMYQVPPTCVARLSSSPLEHMYISGTGAIARQWHDRVPDTLLNSDRLGLKEVRVKVSHISRPV